MLDVVHEALIRHWKQLREWQNQYRAMFVEREIEAQAKQWKVEGKPQDPGLLLQGGKLVKAEEYLTKYGHLGMLDGVASEYIEESRKLRDRLLSQEKERTKRQLILASSAVVFFAGFAIFAGYQWRKAEIQQIKAFIESSEARLLSDQTLDARIESLRAGKTLQQSFWQVISPEAGLRNQVLGKLSQTIYGGQELNRLEGHQDSVTSVAFSPDGKQLATSGYDSTAHLWQVGGRDELLSINCDLVRDYLKNNVNVDEGDRHLCDGIDIPK